MKNVGVGGSNPSTGTLGFDSLTRYYNNLMSLKHYNHRQIEEIKKHVWIESEKAGRDVATQATLDWIKKHSFNFSLEFAYLKQIKDD